MEIKDILEQELFKRGQEAISSFLGYDYPEDEEKDVTSERIQKKITEMSEEEFAEAVNKNIECLVAYNILWDVDMESIMDAFDSMTVEEASAELGIPTSHYSNMTTEERHDFIYDRYHHHSADKAEFMELPNEVYLPKELVWEDDISDYLSDEYGYCHEGFNLRADS